MKYPILAQVKRAPGKGGKMSNRAFDAKTGDDITRSIVYATLKNALDKGMYLYKENENSAWTQVDSNSTLDVKEEETKPNEVMAFLKTCVDKRPDTLFMEDLNWKFICRNVYRGANMLLTGPTGTGKSQTAIAVAKEIGRAHV